MSATPTNDDHPLTEDVKQQQTSNELPSLSIENEQLRREIVELRRQLSRKEDLLQKHQSPTYRIPPHPAVSAPSSNNSNNNIANTNSSHTRRLQERSPTNRNNSAVVLEMPATIRSKSSSSNNIKDHQSVSTADERETVERLIDIESHQSAAGLYRRSSHHLSNSSSANITTATSSPHEAQQAELLMDDEYSSSCKDSSDEDDLMAESRDLIGSDLLERKSLKRNRQNDGIMQERAVDESNPNQHRQMTFFQSLADRAGWLIGLLIFQSLSSFILARNESLLQHHTVIVQFLTMLVGAGGNAGNQASVGVVRGIAVGTVNRSNAKRVLMREFAMGVALSIILGLAGCARAKVFAVPWMETIAITTSLFMIVIISVITGATLPMCMEAVGIDPAHSSTTIQVIMDITGVVITVHVCSYMLDSDFHDWLADNLSIDVELA